MTLRIGYLIQAHDNPVHLQRLIQSLDHADCRFFIHIDKKKDLDQFQHLAADNVEFVAQRVAVYWGDFSQVEATLSLITAALRASVAIDRMVLLAGTDYPVRSAAAIQAFFEADPEREYMNLVEMPNAAAGKQLSRIEQYHLRNNWPRWLRPVRAVLLRLKVFPRARDYRSRLGALTPYAGSQWWALSRQACQSIVDFCQARPEVVDFFKNTACPDEGFFQTILGNTPLRGRIASNLTYTVWGPGRASPDNLTLAHLPAMMESVHNGVQDVYGKRQFLFARKFSDAQSAVVDQIDALR